MVYGHIVIPCLVSLQISVKSTALCFILLLCFRVCSRFGIFLHFRGEGDCRELFVLKHSLVPFRPNLLGHPQEYSANSFLDVLGQVASAVHQLWIDAVGLQLVGLMCSLCHSEHVLDSSRVSALYKKMESRLCAMSVCRVSSWCCSSILKLLVCLTFKFCFESLARRITYIYLAPRVSR